MQSIYHQDNEHPDSMCQPNMLPAIQMGKCANRETSSAVVNTALNETLPHSACVSCAWPRDQ